MTFHCHGQTLHGSTIKVVRLVRGYLVTTGCIWDGPLSQTLELLEVEQDIIRPRNWEPSTQESSDFQQTCQWGQLGGNGFVLAEGCTSTLERLLRGQPSNAWRWRHHFLGLMMRSYFWATFSGRGRERAPLHCLSKSSNHQRGRNFAQPRVFHPSIPSPALRFLFCFILLFAHTLCVSTRSLRLSASTYGTLCWSPRS
jgi:hypothetical protein